MIDVTNAKGTNKADILIPSNNTLLSSAKVLVSERAKNGCEDKHSGTYFKN